VISSSALPAHLENHGDHLVGPEACDGIDNDCDGAVDEAGVCLCPCDFSLPDPPLPFRDPEWECRHPRLGDALQARLLEREIPTKALWLAAVAEDVNDPDLHACGTVIVDPDGRIVDASSIFGLDDAQARGCVDWIIENAAAVGAVCVPD